MSFADVMRWLVVLLVPFAAASSADITARVKVDFYMESLCPFCGIFATSTLKDMMGEIGEIVELSMIPSGNMRPDAEGTLQCQHGPGECEGNRVEACAIHLHPDQHVWFPFVNCFEENFPENREFAARTAEKCAKLANISALDVQTCAQGPLGVELAEQMTKQTAGLDPPHQFVPWVVIDGGAYSGGTDAIPYRVCQAYKGVPPPACSKYRPPSPGSVLGLTSTSTTKKEARVCMNKDRTHFEHTNAHTD
eukprot:CAMPEP_0198214690 /NCGR_PEP_ID=MMETSP1445-20131203/43233_1 /TAXON_ID=36898 /ORGANISM="Pyramimonas sp., Strain CCMP2087" /LENGTH=249 /DNA_ID=CAMNT_0043889977 /DNA_START=17 /DNA_END=763 /DNA_ORIENTATION=+